MTAPDRLQELVERFDRNREIYKSGQYKETEVRRELIDPLFKLLGWDMDNRHGYAEAYKEVVHEYAIRQETATRAPDYCFRVGGQPKFFVEAKKPSVDIAHDITPAFQLRRYAWSAKLPLSILTDFEEFAVYDCRTRPAKNDKPGKGRTMLIAYSEYASRWDEIAGVFSKDAILKGSFDKYAVTGKGKRGTSTVDAEFLAEIERWRDILAKDIARKNPALSVRELNYAVQMTIDRIIFLRICEDRGIEKYGQLMALQNSSKIYRTMFEIFKKADQKYNSGLFHFHHEKERPGAPDDLSQTLDIDDKVLKDIVKNLYYPDSPYEFSVLPSDILGQVYEQFLGKVIRLTTGHQAKVEDKPEVKKAGGVYYTPTYIVDYIVKNTVGKLLDGKTPKQAEKIKILDPACGSGSFLLGAYQYLLDWHLRYYTEEMGLGSGVSGLEKKGQDGAENVSGAGCLENLDGHGGGNLQPDAGTAGRGKIRPGVADAEGSGVRSGECGRGIRQNPQGGLPASSVDGGRSACGTGNAADDYGPDEIHPAKQRDENLALDNARRKNAPKADLVSKTPQTLNPKPQTRKKFPVFQAGPDDWRLTTAERKRILTNNIFGVDIDPQAVEVTKLSLLLKVLEGENEVSLNKQLTLFHERALPDLDDNIKCGNSLIGPDFFSDSEPNLFASNRRTDKGSRNPDKGLQPLAEESRNPDKGFHPLAKESRNPDKGLQPLAGDCRNLNKGLQPLVNPSSENMIDSDDFIRINPFDWKHEFPSVFLHCDKPDLWFVTFVTHNSRVSERMIRLGVTDENGKGLKPLVLCAADQIFMAEKIFESAFGHGIPVVALNVLPDHVHMVIPAMNETELNNFVGTLKGCSAKAFNEMKKTKSAPVWAQKFNRKPVEDDDALAEIVEYVHNNHYKHRESWGDGIVETWNKGLKPLVERHTVSAEKARESGGFDAVIGNPPYVRQETLGEAFKTYAQKNFKTYHGMADLFVYFIEKGHSLLKKGGKFSYIVANKWMRANYGQPLREWLANRNIEEIIDFGDLPVFQNATTYPCVIRISRQGGGGDFDIVNADTLDFASLSEYVNERKQKSNRDRLDPAGWSLSDNKTLDLLEKLKHAGAPLGEYVDGKIFRGVLTGLNEAFVIDAETRAKLIKQDKKSAEIIKPFLAGRDIKRYMPTVEDKYLILFRRGFTNANCPARINQWDWLKKQYPAVAGHLAPFEGKAKKRCDKGDFWWELRACDYYDEFEKPKMLLPDISLRGNVMLDHVGGVYCVNTAYIIASSEKYLLGILNSSLLTFFYRHLSSSYRGGYLRFIYQFLVQLPIRKINFDDKADIEKHDRMVKLVETMLELNRRLQEAKTPGQKSDKGLQPLAKESKNPDKGLQPLAEDSRNPDKEFHPLAKESKNPDKGFQPLAEDSRNPDKEFHPLAGDCRDLNKGLKPLVFGSRTPLDKIQLERQISMTDRQIDQLVYELYGLTDAEIKIVEG